MRERISAIDYKKHSCFKAKFSVKTLLTRLLIFAYVFAIFISSFFGSWDINGYTINTLSLSAFAQTNELEEDISKEIDDQLGNLDFSEVEEYLSSITETTLFSGDFVTTVKSLINGEYNNGKNFFSSVFSLLWNGLLEYLPIIATIIAVSILGGMLSALKPQSGGKSMGNIIHFVTFGIVVVFLGATIAQLVRRTTLALTSLKNVMDAVFPILLTLLTAVGGTTSVGLYQPAVAMLSNFFVYILNHLLLPLFVFAVVFSIVGNLSENLHLDKFVSFINSTFKWTIGLLFTLFLGFISIQGLSASAVDGLSIRTAKYTLKSYIPIVGGYVSDGLSIILASTMLIKNAVGSAGLLFVLLTVVSPVIDLILFSLSLKLMAGITQPIGNKKTATFVSQMSNCVSLLIALIVAVGFMYMVLTGLIMCSANLL